MKIAKTQGELQDFLHKARQDSRSIGYVPTLGALHDGHGSLIRKSNRTSDVTVCSIFLNPTQFNEKSDLDKYPKTYDSDIALLKKNKCDILYYPSSEEVYPNGYEERPDIDLKGLDKVMEGAFRPGHFDGVIQVVKRLLELVEPNQLYMGQKDFQQFTLIQHMIDYYKLSVELVVCPIKREPHGLAMSSRNLRLNPKIREQADVINKTLKAVARRIKTKSVENCIAYAMKRLNQAPFKAEYFSIVDGYTLKDVNNYESSSYVVACTAVWAGEIRLIDNKILKKVD